MAIFDISNAEKDALKPEPLLDDPYAHKESAAPKEDPAPQPRARDRFFSTCAARLFFLLLLVADLLWTCYALCLLMLSLLGLMLSLGKVRAFDALKEKAWVSLRRSLVCGVSLFLALFSPAFGIMIACTYFLMYDKSGIEEVVPSSLQAQFKEFLPSE